MAYFTFENKKVFYTSTGEGAPILMLHGNTASSGMFDSITEMYAKDFRIILIDYPGHGKSARVKKFEADFWFYNSKVCIALLDELNLENVAVIGTSGGALIGINMAMEYPDRVNFLFADSFSGEYPPKNKNANIITERERSKKNMHVAEFWEFNHGPDWESVVDSDTAMQVEFCETESSFFHLSIAALKVPTILTGSKEDDLIHSPEVIYSNLKIKNEKLEIHLFETGSHPAILSNALSFYQLVIEKLKAGASLYQLQA